MDENKPRGRGRPRLTEEEKIERALARKRDTESLTTNSNESRLQNMQPGDNSKFLRHALVTLNMPPIDISDPKQVEDRIAWYFNHCIENDMKPAVKGFCNALGIPRKTLWAWREGIQRPATHQAIILKAYDTLEELWEDYMLNGKINPVSGIFLAKNHWGYADKQEYVLTPNTGGIEAVDPATIEAKYAELPDD